MIRQLTRFVFLLISLIAFVTAGWFYYQSFQAPPARFELTLTAGSEQGQRHSMAQHLAQHAAAANIQLTIQASAGSEQALDQVNNGQIDLALVMGGLRLDTRSQVRQAAVLQIEPLHLLVKQSLYDTVRHDFGQLAGKKVNLGHSASGTHSLAVEVLRYAGISRVAPWRRDYQTLLHEVHLAKPDLPDAIFMVSSLLSPVADKLIEFADYRLLPLGFVNAMALQPTRLDHQVDTPQADDNEQRVIRQHLYPTEIPAYAYQVSPPVPAQNISTIGTRLLLVAHETVPDTAIQRLLEVIYQSPFASRVQPTLTTQLLEQAPETAWHSGTLAYKQALSPLLPQEVLATVEKSLRIGASLATGIGFFFAWLHRARRRKRIKRFKQQTDHLHALEHQLLDYEQSQNINASKIRQLQQQLFTLKKTAVQELSNDVIAGEEFLSGFLLQVSMLEKRLSTMNNHQEPL